MQAAKATYTDRKPGMYRHLRLGVFAVMAVTLAIVPMGALLPASVVPWHVALAVGTAGLQAFLLLRFGRAALDETRIHEQRKIATLLDAVPEGILEIDAGGTIVFANTQISELFGYAPHELFGRSVEDLVPARVRDRHATWRAAFANASRARAMGSGLDIYGVRKDGTEVPVDISLRKLETPRGPVMYCLVRDNSARKAFESQLVSGNQQLLESVATLERNALELRKLTEMGDLLHSSSTVAEIFSIAAHTMEQLFPRLSGALFALSDSRSAARLTSHWGSGAGHLRSVISRDDCWALRRSRPHGIVNATDGPRCNHYSDDAGRPCQCIPLLGHGDLLGVLHLFAADFSEADEFSDPSRVQFIHALANQVASSMANLRLRESLLAQSIIDPLTGVYNRRVIADQFETQIRTAVVGDSPLCLLAIDIDHFKTFNDRFGHESGDIALKALASVLRGNLRPEDVVCRLGGEEFVVLLPDTDVAGAQAAAEKLRRAVEAMPVERNARSLGQMTVSIGIASAGGQTTTAANLLRKADRALYRAKSAGRNCVVAADDGDETGIRPLLSAAPRRA